MYYNKARFTLCIAIIEYYYIRIREDNKLRIKSKFNIATLGVRLITNQRYLHEYFVSNIANKIIKKKPVYVI